MSITYYISQLYKNNLDIYENIFNYSFKDIDIYNLLLNNCDLNNFNHNDFKTKILNYKDKLLLTYHSLYNNNNNNNKSCYLKNICILYSLIIDKITDTNYLDNNIITTYLNNIVKDTKKNYYLSYFNYKTNYNSYEIIIYLCYNKLYNFNIQDLQNYYDILLNNKNNHLDIFHKRFLGTLLYAGYDIKYNNIQYNKDKLINFAKYINDTLFIKFDDVKLIFNALFEIDKIYENNNINKYINFNNKFYLINILFNINLEDKISDKLINYYIENIEDLHYYKYNCLYFFNLDNKSFLLIIEKLIEQNKLDIKTFNIIYKSLIYISKKYNFTFIDEINKTFILTKLFEYINTKNNLNEQFYIKFFNYANLIFLNDNIYVSDIYNYDYYFVVLKNIIPRIKSFNILYNIFYYDNATYDVNILYNLIDRKFFNQNVFELALLVDNSELIDYYIKNNLININNHNFKLAIKFNNINLYNHIINNKYIISDDDLKNIDNKDNKDNINLITINNFKNNFFNKNKNIDIDLLELNDDYNIKYNLNLNKLDLYNNINLINKAYFYNHYEIIQNKKINKHNKEILKLVKRFSKINSSYNINVYINNFKKIVNYINNIKDDNKYNYVLLAVNNLHNGINVINNFLLILKLFYIKFKIKPTIYSNLPDYLFY